MKGILESSLFLFLFALLCYISIDFICLNQKISKVDVLGQWVENQIETQGLGVFRKEGVVLEETLANTIQEQLNQNQMEIHFTSIDFSSEYGYLKYEIWYELKLAVIPFSSKGVYHGIARVRLAE